MSRSDYPFDENGNYHEEWAKGNTSSNVVDLTKNNPPSVFAETSDARDNETPPEPKRTVAAPKEREKETPKPKPKPVAEAPKPKPKPAAPPAPKFTTVKVQKGDTLYSLAKRNGTTVPAIQSANGMGGSTNLKDGSSLKIPN
jgi:LysM repeat protein